MFQRGKTINKESNDGNESIMSWAERAKNMEKVNKKKEKLLTKKNKNLFNYGVMQDFFNFSAMSIQSSLKEVDVDN